jgi:hypothetical protein
VKLLIITLALSGGAMKTEQRLRFALCGNEDVHLYLNMCGGIPPAN